jgi:hypothetical protein
MLTPVSGKRRLDGEDLHGDPLARAREVINSSSS